MLEKMPRSVGRALRNIRAGYDKVASEDPAFAPAPDTIRLESAAFEDGGSIPARYTADGARISPPLRWRGVPPGAEGLVLILEDPDAPTPDPLLHLLVWDLPPDLREVPEGEFKSPHHGGLDEVLGKNSYRQAAYLPPDPPTGHGSHGYVFQLFALDRRLNFEHRPPTLKAVKAAMKGRVLAKGVLVGTYERA